MHDRRVSNTTPGPDVPRSSPPLSGARLTGTKNLRKVGLSTVDRELSKARRLFNIAVDEGWLLRSPFTKAVSKNLIHDAAETPNPIKTRELTDEETLRVINELGGVTLYQCSSRHWILEPKSPACWKISNE